LPDSKLCPASILWRPWLHCGSLRKCPSQSLACAFQRALWGIRWCSSLGGRKTL